MHITFFLFFSSIVHLPPRAWMMSLFFLFFFKNKRIGTNCLSFCFVLFQVLVIFAPILFFPLSLFASD